MMGESSRYRFGPLERRGLIAGWRGGQIAVVGSGLVIGVMALRRHANVLGVLLALGALGASLAIACWPVAGRTGEEWFPTVVRWGTTGLKGRRQRAAISEMGHCLDVGGTSTCMPVPVRRVGRGSAGGPGAFGGLSLLGVQGDREAANRVGVIHDIRSGGLTAVLALEGHNFALLGADEQERRVTGWSGVLAALAQEGSCIRRVQWLATAVPDDGRAVRAYLGERSQQPDGSPARVSYAQLLDQAGADISRHAVVLAVQVASRGRRDRGADSPAALLREISNLTRLLAAADITCQEVLDPGSLVHHLRSIGQSDPPTSVHSAFRSTSRPCPPCALATPWPMAIEAEWSRVRTDETWHATYWIAEWPRVDVGPDFLAPLLLGSIRRSISVVMEPIPPSRAVRAVEQARTADIADSELRRRGGFLSTARRAREAELVARRETELADGHGSYRLSGYVTVTAAECGQLEECCAATEHAAGQAHLELRRLYGDQERGLLCSLPLCRGLG